MTKNPLFKTIRPVKTPNALRVYPAVDYAQIADQGAICYIDGNFVPTRQSASDLITDAVVSYEDAAGQVHASRFESVHCQVSRSRHIPSGTRVLIAAEFEWRNGPTYSGIAIDCPERARAFETDPACDARVPTAMRMLVR